MRRRRRRSDCPIHFGLEVFGDPWTLLILRDLLLKGRSTYSDFLHAEEGIATNVLADRLTRLEQDGLVVAERGVEGGRARRYRPTQGPRCFHLRRGRPRYPRPGRHRR